jgi:hypothetical protein
MGRPPLKPDGKTKRITIAVPSEWVQRLEEWRRKQAGLPNVSEAIRTLVELGMQKGRRR